IELGGADVPGARIDRPPPIGINLLDRALAVIGGILVGIVGLVVLAAKDRAAGQQGKAGAQQQGAQGRLKTDRRYHSRSLVCAQKQAFSKACRRPNGRIAQFCLYIQRRRLAGEVAVFLPPPASTSTPPAAAPVEAASPLGVLLHAKGEA